MKVLTKFYLNKKSNRIIDEFYIKNDKLSLTDLLLKSNSAIITCLPYYLRLMRCLIVIASIASILVQRPYNLPLPIDLLFGRICLFF